MARSKSNNQINLEYAVVWPLFKLFTRLPRAWVEPIVYGILRAVLWVMPKRASLMRRHIAAAFPELQSREHETIARESLVTLARGLAVFVKMPALLTGPPLPWLRYEGHEHLLKARALGRGVISFTAHMGCWEIMSSYVMRHGIDVAAVYRPLDNPKIDALVTHLRCSAGGFMIDRRKVIREGLRFLRANGLLGVLIDQNFAGGGVFVDFFGRLAATTPLVSILARRTGSVVLPMHNWWEGDVLHLKWDPPFELSREPDANAAVAEDTQRMTTVVEGWIREKPGQWLWLHNRWKRQPQPGERIPA